MNLFRLSLVVLFFAFPFASQSESLNCQIQLEFNRTQSLHIDFLGFGTLKCNGSLLNELSAEIRLYEKNPTFNSIQRLQISSASFNLSDFDELWREFTFNTDGHQSVLYYISQNSSQNIRQIIPLTTVSSDHFAEWQVLQLLHYSRIEIDQELYNPGFD